MNRTTHKILSFILGSIFRMKTDYFYMLPSAAKEELWKDGTYNILRDWMKANPNQVLSPQKAAELIKNAKKQ